jgi:CheY-like chemotaxis protein
LISGKEKELRILVADDDLVFSHLLEQRLLERDYQVLVAHDALQAWQFARRDVPDLVLLDIKMPGGTGLAVLQRLKSNLRVKGIPVIVITSLDDPSILEQIQAQNPEALLHKPIQFEELMLEINRALAARELAKPERLIMQREKA